MKKTKLLILIIILIFILNPLSAFAITTHTLTVTKTGTGSGNVAGFPFTDIGCGADCSETYSETYDEGTVVIITPYPDYSSIFAGWSGDAGCSDNQVTMDADRTCIATFVLNDYLFFVNSAFTVNEDGGSAILTVQRTINMNGTSTVDYATSDMTATANIDYSSVSGTLTFLPGETSKTFSVPIIDDIAFEDEGDETIKLTLSNPGNGVSIGSPSTAVLTIVDNDPIEHTVDGAFDGAESVYAADMDGDGDMDVLGAAYLADDITWWENKDGSGTSWTKHLVDDYFFNAASVYAVDMDGDGDMDILGANMHVGGSFFGPITWWENTSGLGTSWVIHRISDSFEGAESAYASDIDGDGDMDVLGASHYKDDIVWFENTDGIGSSWVEHIVDDFFDFAKSVYAADIDGDGDMDILGAASYADDVTWWENTDGFGTVWVEHTVDNFFDGASYVYTADIDSDGDMDILSAANVADDITWWENTDGFGTVWIKHTVDSSFDFASSVYARDIDGDGDIDILGAASYADDVTWWENTDGFGTVWVEHTVDGLFDRASSVYAADVDGDGATDILGAALYADDITWWKNPNDNPNNDRDGDGYTTDTDCNDSNNTIYPGAQDVACNGIDNDCDGSTDEHYVVDSSCGVGICRTNNTPSFCFDGVETLCNAGLPTQVPEATCSDSIDNDCNGLTDAADLTCNHGDVCAVGGLDVRNFTTANRYYFKNTGACYFWFRGNNIHIGSTDAISVRSTNCTTPITCTVDYPYLRAVDSNNDCQIEMTSNNPCIFSDSSFGNFPPTANAGGPYTGTKGIAISFNGSGSIDPNNNISTYEWDIDNDGIYDYSSASSSQSHTYSQQGTYTVKLRVTDDMGEIGEATITVIISNSLPSAGFTGFPASGRSSMTVTYTNSSTGYNQPLIYEWDFDNNGTVDSILSNPSYNYTNAGMYSVKLKVTDSYGSTNSLTKLNYISISSIDSPPDTVYAITVLSGWNLLSLPVQPQDTSINMCLNRVSNIYNIVWAYENSEWKMNNPATPIFNTLNIMEAGKGYWIYMAHPGTLRVAGGIPSNSEQLVSGWNLVGYNSKTAKPIADVLASINGKYVSVWAFINGEWQFYAPGNIFNTLETMQPGYGYWINTTEECTWTLP